MGLSVGYDTLLPTGWHHTFVNSWCENRLGDPSVAMCSGSYDRGKFLPFLKATDCPVAHPIWYCARTLYSPSDIDKAAWLRGHTLFTVGHDDNYLNIYSSGCLWNFMHNTMWLGFSLLVKLLHLWNSFSLPFYIIFKLVFDKNVTKLNYIDISNNG